MCDIAIHITAIHVTSDRDYHSSQQLHVKKTKAVSVPTQAMAGARAIRWINPTPCQVDHLTWAFEAPDVMAFCLGIWYIMGHTRISHHPARPPALGVVQALHRIAICTVLRSSPEAKLIWTLGSLFTSLPIKLEYLNSVCSSWTCVLLPTSWPNGARGRTVGHYSTSSLNLICMSTAKENLLVSHLNHA